MKVSKAYQQYYQIHINRFQKIFREISLLKLPSNSKVLDLGCYPPIIFNQLSHDYPVTGVTFYNDHTSKPPNVYSLNLEADRLPFPSNYFDLLIFTETIEHLINPYDALAEIYRVTKPHGKLILTTPNLLRTQNYVKLLLGQNIYFDLQQLKSTRIADQTIYHRHNREYTLNELSKILTDTGFHLVKKETFISYSPFRTKNRRDPLTLRFVKLLNYLAMLIFPPAKDTLFLVATK
jgi:SAM-dependent methyltransferase